MEAKEAKKERLPKDAELDAIRRIRKIMEGLMMGQQMRVFEFIKSKMDEDRWTQPPLRTSGLARTPLGQEQMADAFQNQHSGLVQRS